MAGKVGGWLAVGGGWLWATRRTTGPPGSPAEEPTRTAREGAAGAAPEGQALEADAALSSGETPTEPGGESQEAASDAGAGVGEVDLEETPTEPGEGEEEVAAEPPDEGEEEVAAETGTRTPGAQRSRAAARSLRGPWLREGGAPGPWGGAPSRLRAPGSGCS